MGGLRPGSQRSRVKTVWVGHRPHQNLQTPQAVAPGPTWSPLSENLNMEADLDRDLRLQPEARRSAMSEGQWSTLLSPLTSGQRPQAPQSDLKVTMTAPKPGVSDMGVDQKRYM